MAVEALHPGRISVAPRRPKRAKLISSGALGMLLFIGTELMMFAGLISAFLIVRAGFRGPWPPPGQPRLPVEETLWNTGALLLSGVVLLVAHVLYPRGPRRALLPLVVSIVLGGLFVGLQGVEWVALLKQGLTLTSSSHGSFFYLIVGAHAAHALGALLALAYVAVRVARGTVTRSELVTVELFWAFVVVLWPFIYARVYF